MDAAAQPLERVSRPRLYEQLVEKLLAYMESAGLEAGDFLPAERDLADRMGVSRATLAQALVALEVLGVIEVKHGTGAVLAYRPNAASVIAGLRAHTHRLPEIVEARSTLEVKLAGFAALRRSAEDLEAIDAALATMEQEIGEGERGAMGDARFHQAVTNAAHSPVLAQLMTVIAGMVMETRQESLGQPGRPKRSLASHRKIAAAIRAKDVERAQAAMQAHIELVSDVELLK